MLRRKKHKVLCSGCANLFYVGGSGAPLCVAPAAFRNGPLRPRIDVVGVVSAERKNRHNDCPLRTSVSIRAYRIKKWLLWRMNDGSESRIKEASLREYPIEREYASEAPSEGSFDEDIPDFFDEAIESENDFIENIVKEVLSEEGTEEEASEGEGVQSVGGVDDSDYESDGSERNDSTGS